MKTIIFIRFIGIY